MRTSSLRVLVASTTSRRVAGIETYIEDLLDELNRRGTATALLAASEDPAERPPIARPALTPLFREMEECRRWHPDVVLANGRIPADWENALCGAYPSAYFIHNFYGVCISGLKRFQHPQPEPCFRRLGPACLGLYLPRACGGRNPLTMIRLYHQEQAQQQRLRGYRRLITHSEHMREEYIRHDFDAERIHVIPFACFPDSRLQHREVPSIDTVNWKQGPVRLLFAGRLETIKGGAELIGAAGAWARQESRPVELTLAGEGEMRPSWEGLAQSLMAENPNFQVHFSGWLDAESLDRAFAEHHLFVMPSLWPEPFGKGGMEAARWACPSVGFRLGGIPQWLHDGVNGHLADWLPDPTASLQIALGKALNDPAHWLALRQGALQRSREFTASAHCDALLPILEAMSGKAKE